MLHTWLVDVGAVILVLCSSCSALDFEDSPFVIHLQRHHTYNTTRSLRVPAWLSSTHFNASGAAVGKPLELAADGNVGVGNPANMVELNNMGNTQYSGEVNLGTPPQPLKVLMDTGSSDLWFFQGRFEDWDSSTLQKSGGDTRIDYGQGFVAGYLATDVLQVCPAVTLPGQSFLVPTSSHGMDTVQADGVLGLALPTLSHTGETVLQKLNTIGIRQFTLALTGTVKGSKLLMGQPSNDWYEGHELNWVPSTTGLWWALDASLSVNGENLMHDSFLLDSGTSYIGLPEPHFTNFINHLLPGDKAQKCKNYGGNGVGSGIKLCPCSFAADAPTVEIQVGDITYPLAAEHLFGRTGQTDESGDVCVVEVMPTQAGMPKILGDTFLRTVVAVFDTGEGADGPRIGLAQQASDLVKKLQPPWYEQPLFGFRPRVVRAFGVVLLCCSLGMLIFHPDMLGPYSCMVVQAVCPCFRVREPAAAKVLLGTDDAAEYQLLRA